MLCTIAFQLLRRNHLVMFVLRLQSFGLLPEAINFTLVRLDETLTLVLQVLEFEHKHGLFSLSIGGLLGQPVLQVFQSFSFGFIARICMLFFGL